MVIGLPGVIGGKERTGLRRDWTGFVPIASGLSFLKLRRLSTCPL